MEIIDLSPKQQTQETQPTPDDPVGSVVSVGGVKIERSPDAWTPRLRVDDGRLELPVSAG